VIFTNETEHIPSPDIALHLLPNPNVFRPLLLPHDFGTHQSTRGILEELFWAHYHEAFENDSDNSEAQAISELPSEEESETSTEDRRTNYRNMHPNALPVQVKQERPHAPAVPPGAPVEAAASSDPSFDNQRPSDADDEVTDPLDLGAIPLENAKYDNGAHIANDHVKHPHVQAAPSGDHVKATAPPPPISARSANRSPSGTQDNSNPKRESLDRENSTSPINQKHHRAIAARPRTPSAKRGRSTHRNSPRVAPKSARSANRSPSGTQDNSNRSRSPPPKKKTHYKCRFHKKIGVLLETATPTCKFGHALSISRVLKLAQFVEPKCSDCFCRLRPSNSCAVCFRCDPLFILCVQCTFRPSTDAQNF
jgi:hypothetical protein